MGLHAGITLGRALEGETILRSWGWSLGQLHKRRPAPSMLDYCSHLCHWVFDHYLNRKWTVDILGHA